MNKLPNNIELFKGLSTQEIKTVLSSLRNKKFQKGEILFIEGKPCERVVIIRSGRVKIFRMDYSGREQILQILKSGDTCACHSGAMPWSCTASAQALTATEVHFLTAADYISLLKKHPDMLKNLAKLFSDRLKCFSSLIEEISLKDVKKRLIKFLLDMEKSARNGNAPTVLTISFTREEIAQRLGSARETISRYLAQMQDDKMISIKPHQITIRNRAALEKLLQEG